ncbi:MAG: hypothetical protein AAB667_00145 [Patescibacteria group bacterium]
MATPGTKQLVAISDIHDSVVILNNGSLRMILEISAINFELRSEEEQAAIIQNFQSFINSVDFPLQIAVLSRKFSIEPYIATIEQAGTELTNDLLRVQSEEYSKFIKELSSLSNIMSKRFYVVVPFFVTEAPSGKGFLDGFKNVFKSNKTVSEIPPEKFQAYRTQLVQRAELVYSGLVGMGLRVRALEDSELNGLMYELYNPGEQAPPTNPQQNAGN